MKKGYIIILLTLSLSSVAYGQIDRDFWFAAPFLANGHDESLAPGNGRMCITSFADTAHITISQPAITDPSSAFYYPTTTLTLLPYSSTDVLISNNKGDLHRATPSKTEPHGIHIESDADVTVYYAQINNNSELYALKGTNALGTDFLVPMQRNRGNGYGCSTIEVVATEPNTTVTITTKVATYLYNTPTTFTVTLQAGEVYTLQSKGSGAQDHLGGTIIHSDKPVAVNSTDDSVQAGGQDLAGDQLVSSVLSGSEYIAMRHNGSAEELVLYTYPDAPITYTINGGAPQTLAANSAVTINLNNYADSVFYIQADTTFVAFQLTSDGAEVGGTILPQLSCTGSREVAVRKRFLHQQLNILVKTTDTASFIINGNIVSLPFQPIPVAPQWSYCYVDGTDMFDSNGVIRVRNTSAIFHMAILDYGQQGGTCSYGYFSGYNQMSMVPVTRKTEYVVGDTIQLAIEDEQLFDDVVWTYPDGSQHVGGTQQIIAKSLADAGYYRVTGRSKDECPLSHDYYDILIHVLQPQRYDSTICRSPAYPEDTWKLIDTVQLGHNILKDTMSVVDFQCTSGSYSTAYQTQITMSVTQRYHITFEYASSSTAHPNIQLVMRDSVVSTISQAIVRSQYKTASTDFQPSESGVMQIKVQAGGVANSPKVSVKNLVIQPILPRQDTLYLHVENCDVPCLTPIIKDSSVIERCDTLGAFSWRGRMITAPGIYRDTIWSRGCDSLYYILNLTFKHCERPCPDLQVFNTDTTVCDTLMPFIWRGFYFEEPGMQHDDTIKSPRGCDSILYTYTLVTKQCLPDICLDIVAQRWNDVLGVMNSTYNGGYTFVSYQWFVNNELMPGETKSYIYIPATFREGDCYRAEMTTEDGTRWKTCPYCPDYVEYTNEGLEPIVTKRIENNHLVIIRQGKRYNAVGEKIEN